MLEAYVDDSGTDGPPVAVLAGLVAPAEAWAAFSDDWRRACDASPRIDYFKMVEASGCRDQFRGWTHEARDKKVSDLVCVICRHAILTISSTIRHSDFNELVKGSFLKGTDTPYFWLFCGVIQSIVMLRHQYNLPPHPVDFYFDKQVGQEEPAKEGWHAMLKAAPDVRARAMIGHGPKFQDDKVVVALQAADLVAWRTRRAFDKSRGNRLDTDSQIWKPLDAIHMARNDWERRRIKEVMAGCSDLSQRS